MVQLLLDNQRPCSRYCLESNMRVIEVCPSLSNLRPNFIVEIVPGLPL